MGNDKMQLVLWICTAILTLGNVITMFATFINKAKAPNKVQNERISVLEDEMKEVKRYLDTDKKRIDVIEEGNKVTQKGLLALMTHALSSQEDDKLMAAKDELERYLINR